MNFCDFCSCEDCITGDCKHEIFHAKTSDDKFICDVCYTYDVCTSGSNRSLNGPCEDKECIHRPKIISEWLSNKL